MPQSQIAPLIGKGKNKNNSKNTIQVARHEKSSTNTNDTVFEYDSFNSPSDSDWTTNNGKRNLSDSSNPSSPNHDPSKKIQKLFITANRYEPLAQTESANSPVNPPPETPIIADKIKLQPPIFVKGVINFPDLCSSLIEIIGVDNFVCKSSTDSLKIQTSNPESYRTLIHFLKEKKAQYHTFQLKEDKRCVPLSKISTRLHPQIL